MLINAYLKYLLILLIFTISFSCLAGCDNSSNQTTNKLGNDLGTNNITDEVTLSFYFEGNVDKNVNEIRKMLDEVENRSKQHLNIKLDFRWISDSEYVNKIKELINSGDNFDAFVLRNSVKDYIDQNLIMDLSKLFPQYATEYYLKFGKYGLNHLMYNGKLATIPMYLPRSKRMCAVVRQDFMEKYSIPGIKNYKDYENYLKIVKENESNITPGSILSTDYTDDLFAESFGYYIVDNYFVAKWDESPLRIIPWEQVPQYEEAVETKSRWLKNKYIKVSDLRTMQNDAFNGIIASYLCFWHDSGYSYINNNLKYNYKLYPLYPDEISAALDTYSIGIAINKNSRNARRVIEFIEWVQSSQENYDLFMYGIKGENYVMKGESVALTSDTKPISNWPGSDVFTNMDYKRIDINQPADYMETYEKSSKLNAKYTPISIMLNEVTDISEINRSIEPFEALLNERAKNIEEIEKNLANIDIIKQTADFISRQKNLGVNNFTEEFAKSLNKQKK